MLVLLKIIEVEVAVFKTVETLEIINNSSLFNTSRIHRDKPDLFTIQDEKDFVTRFKLTKDF